MLKIFYVSIFLIFAFMIRVSAQAVSGDSLFLAKAKANSVKLYSQKIMSNSGLYNGAQYVEPKTSNDDHPFFETDEWQWGSVYYNNELYTMVPLMYDLTSDRVISESHNSTPIILVPEKVTSFTIDQFVFEAIKADSVNSGLPTSGFYQVLHSGKTKLLAKHIKNHDERIEDNKLEQYFPLRTRYYVLKDGTYFRVAKKNDLFKVLSDKKSALKSWVNKNNLSFRKQNLGLSLTSVTSYYDTLTSGK